MKVEQLTLKNFLSHKQTTLRLSDLGVVLLEGQNRDRGGSNGSGKSSVIAGIYWGLFGQALSAVKLNDLSFRSEGNMRVEVLLRQDDGTPIRVVRTNRVPNAAPLLVEVNGQEINAGTATETQKKLNSLLRMDARLFKHVVLFTSASEAFAALTDKGQKETLDAILGLDRLPKALDVARERFNKFKADRYTLDIDAQRVYDLEAQALRNTERLRKAEAEWRAQRKAALRQLSDQVFRLEQSEVHINPTLVKQLEIKRKRLNALAPECQNAALEGQFLLERLLKGRQELTKLEMTVEHAKAAKARVELVNADEFVAENNTCPTCSQGLPLSALRSLVRKIEKDNSEKRQELENLELTLSTAAENLEKYRAENDAIQRNYDTLTTASAEYRLLQGQVVQEDADLKLLQAKRVAWESALASAQQSLAQAQDAASPYTDLLKAEEITRQGLAEQAAKIRAEQAVLDQEQAYYEFWKVGFSNQGVKGLILDTVTPFLNERANYYLGIASDGGASVDFQTHWRDGDGEVKEKFQVQAGYSSGSGTYQGASDGERRRIDLAVLFAIGDLAAARTGQAFKLRLLDEPFGPLDALGAQQVRRLLDKLAESVGTVLVTAHEDGVKTLFEKQLTVVKESGVSHVEQ